MKNSYYFPHDYHARHDPKLERLRMSMGCEGIGIYWCLVEMLYEEEGSLRLKDIEIYAKALNTTPENIQKTLSDFNLFVKNKTHFYSITLLKRLKHINTKREKASTSAKLSHSANADRTHSERSAIKESKVKESKGKEIKEQRASPVLKTALNKVYKEGLNIYALLNKLKKESKVGAQVPEEVLLKVCDSFDKNKVDIKNPWTWFCQVVAAEWRRYNADRNIKEGQEWKKEPAQSIKEILNLNTPYPACNEG